MIVGGGGTNGSVRSSGNGGDSGNGIVAGGSIGGRGCNSDDCGSTDGRIREWYCYLAVMLVVL